MSVALVLSGGGSRGAFEVGAALFLYDTYAVRPDIICATSVGAINGAKLAEGGTPEGKRAALGELRNFWLELKGNGDMWEEAEWLIQHGDLPVGGGTVRDLILPAVTGQPSPTAHGETPFLRDNFPWLLDFRTILAGVGQLILTVRPLTEKAGQGKLRSIMRLRPIEDRMRGIVRTPDTTTMAPPGLDSEKVRQSGVRLRLALVSLEAGALRYVTEDGQLLERDNVTPALAPVSVTRPDPTCAAQAAEAERRQLILDELQGADPPWTPSHLRAIEAAKKDLADALKNLGACEMDHPPRTVVESPSVDLTTAVIASATMPAIFEPRLIAGEYYVDGGVREIAPVKAAFDVGGEQLEHVYVVMASALNVPRAPSFATADFFTVMMHSLVDLGLNEIVRDDASPPAGWPKPVDVIAPSFDLYNPTVVDPGLIRIHMDYGLMRAAEVARHKPPRVLSGVNGGRIRFGGPGVAPVAPSAEPVRNTDFPIEKSTQLSDAVTLLRLAAWDAEFTVFSRPHVRLDAPPLPYRPPDMFSALQWVRLLKWLTKAVVDFRARHSLPLPSTPWVSWEAHTWLPAESLWQEFSTPSGVVESVDDFNGYLPQGALIRDPDNGAVYTLWNGSRIHVRDEAEFSRMGLNWADVREMPSGVADCLPLEQRL